MSTDALFDLDVHKLISAVGGPGSVASKLNLFYDVPLTHQQVYKWTRRNSISSSNLMAVLYLARAEGQSTNLFDYLRRPGS